MLARITLAQPTSRASIIGGESESAGTVTINLGTKKARTTFSQVTQFAPGGNESVIYAVGSTFIEVDVNDAFLQDLLTKFVNAAKSQGKLPANCTLSFV